MRGEQSVLLQLQRKYCTSLDNIYMYVCVVGVQHIALVLFT